MSYEARFKGLHFSPDEAVRAAFKFPDTYVASQTDSGLTQNCFTQKTLSRLVTALLIKDSQDPATQAGLQRVKRDPEGDLIYKLNIELPSPLTDEKQTVILGDRNGLRIRQKVARAIVRDVKKKMVLSPQGRRAALDHISVAADAPGRKHLRAARILAASPEKDEGLLPKGLSRKKLKRFRSVIPKAADRHLPSKDVILLYREIRNIEGGLTREAFSDEALQILLRLEENGVELHFESSTPQDAENSSPGDSDLSPRPLL